MIVRRLIVCFLFFITASSQAFAVPERLDSLESAGFEMTSVSRLGYGPLMTGLQEIENRTSLSPQLDSTDLTPRVAVNGDVLVVELKDSERPWETTFLFYLRDSGQVLFLRARSVVGDPEVRLWSQGQSEIVVSNQGIKRQATPSSDTFRFDHLSDATGTKISATDALVCLARILGLSSTNWSSAISFLTNLSCSQAASVTFDAIETLLHCFSMVSVGVANLTSTAGCVVGLTKLIGCGYLTCGAPPSVPGGLTASDGSYSDRVRVSWNQTEGASTYTLYRSQSSGSIGSELTTTSSTSYDDTSAVAGENYYYRIKACSSLGCSSISGYDAGWRSVSSGGGCSGTTYSGTLSAGNSAVQPNGDYYQSTRSGTHSGKLTGPTGSDFDLYLYKWNGTSWGVVASRDTSSNVENLSYSGTAGYYSWVVYAYSGSGSYTLCLSYP